MYDLELKRDMKHCKTVKISKILIVKEIPNPYKQKGQKCQNFKNPNSQGNS
ncbi:hypothetical protein M405DRAFT_864946 [Rhizopogon salebrosus TDB-379]|nr:hypothetical protein M405DRAFT_864946 [Rhizopogon salebrosus TDB-379]